MDDCYSELNALRGESWRKSVPVLFKIKAVQGSDSFRKECAPVSVTKVLVSENTDKSKRRGLKGGFRSRVKTMLVVGKFSNKKMCTVSYRNVSVSSSR